MMMVVGTKSVNDLSSFMILCIAPSSRIVFVAVQEEEKEGW
jgi:hypothetical protein